MSRNGGSCKWVMSDGRAYTSYEPICQTNEYIKNKYAPGASSEYRYFLQHNACAIMKEMRDRNGFVNPSGCQCNYNHPPHNPEKMEKYHWQPSAGYLGRKNADFNTPIPSPGGNWTNYC